MLLTAAAAAAADTAGVDPGKGCLHGTVTTTDGRVLTGFLRTEHDDAFWDDILRATLTASPWADVIDTEALARQRRAAYFREHGLIDRIAYVLAGGDRHDVEGREFLCRYGQVARITLTEGTATIETIDGGRHVCRRRVPDLRGDLTVAGSDLAVVAWDDVRDVVFTQAAPGDAPPWRRLAGTVTTSDGVLEGFIQWDQSECTSIDILDGDDREIPLGELRSLTKNRQGHSDVVLTDGDDLDARVRAEVGDAPLPLAIDAVGGSGTLRLARCVSDVAAMAGTPVAALATVTLPRDFEAERSERLFDAIRRADYSQHQNWQIFLGYLLLTVIFIQIF